MTIRAYIYIYVNNVYILKNDYIKVSHVTQSHIQNIDSLDIYMICFTKGGQQMVRQKSI
jgi:hypothetical protein